MTGGAAAARGGAAKAACTGAPKAEMSPSSAAGGDRCDAAAAASGTTAADGLTVEVRSGRKDWPALIRAPCASEARLGGIDADDARRPGLHMNMRTMSVEVVIGGASPSPACRGVGRSGAPLAATGVGATVGVGGGGGRRRPGGDRGGRRARRRRRGGARPADPRRRVDGGQQRHGERRRDARARRGGGGGRGRRREGRVVVAWGRGGRGSASVGEFARCGQGIVRNFPRRTFVVRSGAEQPRCGIIEEVHHLLDAGTVVRSAAAAVRGSTVGAARHVAEVSARERG